MARIAPSWMMTLNAAHLLGVEAEQLGGEDQVPGRGDRQELGDALDDAEDDRDQQDWHRQASRVSGRGQMNSPAGEAVAGRSGRAIRRRPRPAASAGCRTLRAPVRPPPAHCRAGASATGRGSAARPAASRSATADRRTRSGSRRASGVWPVSSRIALVKLDHASSSAGRRSHRSCRHGVCGSSAALAIACARSRT